MTAQPSATVVIPAHERPESLRAALDSALAQTLRDIEVIVVDDGSDPPLAPAPDPRVRVIRLESNSGVSIARNTGLAAAQGRWVTFLDDDDLLTPAMLERSIAALEGAPLPPPVATVSAAEVVDRTGRVVELRVPPTMPRGCHWALERAPRRTSFHTKQTLVVSPAVLREIGGFDPALDSRELTDLFLRLNPVCSILGLRDIGLRHTRHGSGTLSTDPARRQRGFAAVVHKHREAFAAHPAGHAALQRQHARVSWRMGQRTAALRAVALAARLAPRDTFAGALGLATRGR